MNSKKIFPIICLSLILLFLMFGIANAALCDTSCQPTASGQACGLVPCGQTSPDGKTIPCPCQFEHIFVLLNKIYNFIVKMIAAPLAVIALIVGGILIMISAGNPELLGKGKKTLYAAIIGLALVFGSWVIINTILSLIGYQGAWSIL
jgi:hypothetical protein